MLMHIFKRIKSTNLYENADPSMDFWKQTKNMEKMCQMKNLEIFASGLWIACKMGEEIQGKSSV